MNELYSFDIFDTLVTRRVATPKGIFSLVQSYIADNSEIPMFVRQNFFQIRIGAEEYARKRTERISDTCEICFDDIYDTLRDNYLLTQDVADYIKNLEFKTEINNLIALNKNLDKAKELKAQGKRVILVSDMYYGERELKLLLQHIDPFFSEVKIYSSCDWKVSKYEGDLYDLVREKESNPKIWHHYGDNEKADVKQAKKHGVEAIHCPQIELMPYEQGLLDAYENNANYQFIVGSAKNARITAKDRNDVFDFGASFAAPVLFNYVKWAIEQALARNFRTLYFVARDGFILKIIADIIIKTKNIDIKTKYIHGSRQAWRVVSDKNVDDLIDWIFDEYLEILTPEFLSVRLGVSVNKIIELCGVASAKSLIDRKKVKDLAGVFKTNIAVKNDIIAFNQKKISLLKAYLVQEIEIENGSVALVDLFGSGRTQDCLSEILNDIKPCVVSCFYITNFYAQSTDRSVKLCYFLTERHARYWVELICRADEGQTIGYKEENGKIVPVTERIGSQMKQWGIASYVAGVELYAKTYLTCNLENTLYLNLIDFYCYYSDFFCKNPDFKTASVVGKIPYEVTGNEDKFVHTVAYYPIAKYLFYFFTGKRPIRVFFSNVVCATSSPMKRKLVLFLRSNPTLKMWFESFFKNK